MKRNRIFQHSASEGDEGFGLLDVVVAMFLLALLAMSFVPVLIQGMRVSASNAVMARATQLVNTKIQGVHAQGAICHTIREYATSPLPDAPTPSNVKIDVASKIAVPEDPHATCPALPGTLKLTFTATNDLTGEVLARATTLVYVNAVAEP